MLPTTVVNFLRCSLSCRCDACGVAERAGANLHSYSFVRMAQSMKQEMCAYRDFSRTVSPPDQEFPAASFGCHDSARRATNATTEAESRDAMMWVVVVGARRASSPCTKDDQRYRARFRHPQSPVGSNSALRAKTAGGTPRASFKATSRSHTLSMAAMDFAADGPMRSIW